MTNTRSPIEGNAAVVTSDGADLGHVGAMQTHAFRVEALLQPGFWLANSTVMALQTDEVVVGFEREHLEEFAAGTAEQASEMTATQVLMQMHGEIRALLRSVEASASPVLAAAVGEPPARTGRA